MKIIRKHTDEYGLSYFYREHRLYTYSTGWNGPVLARSSYLPDGGHVSLPQTVWNSQDAAHRYLAHKIDLHLSQN